MRNIFLALFVCLMSTFLVAPTFAADATFGGGTYFQKGWLRHDGDTIANIDNPVVGLALGVDMNPVIDEEDGSIERAATWGFEFGTSFVTDASIDVSTLSAESWMQWMAVTVVGGPLIVFLEPTDAATVLTEYTNLLGVTGAVRFDAKGLPAEFGGSWAKSYDGASGVQLSEVHFGLVKSF